MSSSEKTILSDLEEKPFIGNEENETSTSLKEPCEKNETDAADIFNSFFEAKIIKPNVENETTKEKDNDDPLHPQMPDTDTSCNNTTILDSAAKCTPSDLNLKNDCSQGTKFVTSQENHSKPVVDSGHDLCYKDTSSSGLNANKENDICEQGDLNDNNKDKELHSNSIIKPTAIQQDTVLTCNNSNYNSNQSNCNNESKAGVNTEETVVDAKDKNDNNCSEEVDLTIKESISISNKPCHGEGQCKSVENSKESVSKIPLLIQRDPFKLSEDEDFSPKAYKPIKRKLSQGLINFGNHCMGNIIDFDVNDVECEDGDEKKRKMSEEDLSFSEMTSRNRNPVRVAYIYSKELVEKANKLVRIEGRAKLVHSLIEVYGILQHVDLIPPRLATEVEITGFHCQTYIDFLKRLSYCEDLSDSISAEAEAYGLSYDCPLQENVDVYETASLISGGTITAAETLNDGKANIAINWCGGWHHAKRDSASGFCYINDIVLGILKLREKFDRVLYVDLDLHHGDGVEEAFYMTTKVMTVSFHKYAFGFFPGSGSVEDIGSGRGKLYTVNVPLLDGINDSQFFSLFTSVMKKVRGKFPGEAIVIQCGADTLSEDPMASFNLTHVAIAKCICFLLTWNLPTLLLGGGGYNFPNTAKCWTFLTAMAAGKKLPVDIPEHEHLLEYGPSYELTTSPGYRKDLNTKEHFYEIMAKICLNLNNL